MLGGGLVELENRISLASLSLWVSRARPRSASTSQPHSSRLLPSGTVSTLCKIRTGVFSRPPSPFTDVSIFKLFFNCLPSHPLSFRSSPKLSCPPNDRLRSRIGRCAVADGMLTGTGPLDSNGDGKEADDDVDVEEDGMVERDEVGFVHVCCV